jgi:hypothetical protein
LAEHGLSNEPVAIDMPVVTIDLKQVFEKGGIKPGWTPLHGKSKND